MLRAFRLLLVCVLMLTLPLQGVSAAVMAMSQTQDAGQVQMADCHGGHMSAGTHSQPDAALHTSQSPAKTKVCGSCCTGAMLGAHTLPLIAHAPTGNHYRTAHSQASPNPIIEGLERPPRRIS